MNEIGLCLSPGLLLPNYRLSAPGSAGMTRGWILFFFKDSISHYVAQAGLKSQSSCLSLLSAETTDMATTLGSKGQILPVPSSLFRREKRYHRPPRAAALRRKIPASGTWNQVSSSSQGSNSGHYK